MSKKTNEFPKGSIQKETKPNNKRKVVFWSLLASGVGVIIIVALLLIFLLPKEDKFEIDLGSNVSVEDGTLTGEGSYKKGDSVTIVAEDIEGYRFTGWSYGGSIISTDKEFTFQINEENEGEYTANYAKEYNIDIQSGSLTVAIEGNKANAIAGEAITFTIEDQDYQIRKVYLSFANETKELVAQGGKYTFAMPAENVTIDITYSQLFDISVTSEHGTVSITDNKTEAIANENVSFTITPEENYRIESVSINKGSVEYTQDENTYSFTMPAENVTIVVTYIQQLKVILQSDKENANLSGANTYDIGSEVTITASAYLEDQDGNQYRFIGWQHNEEFIPVEEGGIYKFILSADTAGTYTAIYESRYKVEVEENSAQYIQIESTQAFEDDNITFTATVEDIVNDTDVIIKSIKIMANGEEIEYTNDGNQYSFTMPAGNVVISVVEETRANIIKDFVISGNSIKQYTGTDSEVVVPCSSIIILRISTRK